MQMKKSGMGWDGLIDEVVGRIFFILVLYIELLIHIFKGIVPVKSFYLRLAVPPKADTYFQGNCSCKILLFETGTTTESICRDTSFFF